MNYITYDDFKKLDMRIGTIRHVAPVEGADKLLICQVDFGRELATIAEDTSDETIAENILSAEEESKLDQAILNADVEADQSDIPTRQILSGIREFYPDYQQLVGKQVLYVVNLEPRTIRGHVSHGMLMAVGDDKPIFLVPEEPVNPGSQVR